MKRTFATQIQRSLLAVCMVLGAFLFSATSAAAQSASGVNSGSDLNWVPSDDAQQVLVQAILTLRNNPQVSVVGSQPYIQARYFKEIYHNVSDGSSTWQASRNGLNIFSDPGGVSVQQNNTGVVLNTAQKEALFQVAVGLLTI